MRRGKTKMLNNANTALNGSLTRTRFGQHRVAAIDLANVYSQLIIASPNIDPNGYSQVKLEKLVSFDNTDTLKQSLAKEKISLLSCIASGIETLTETISSNLSPANLAKHRRTYGISNDEYISDYLNFPNNTAMLCSFSINDSKTTSQTLSEMHRGTSIISQSDIALVHFYNKIYPGAENSRTAIVNIASDHVSLVVVDKGSPLCVGSLKLESEMNSLTTATSLFQEANNILASNNNATNEETSTPSSKLNYDLILLVGECNEQYLVNLRVALTNSNITVGSIELFNPLIYNFINIDALPTREQQLLNSEGYKYTVAIAGVAMALEYVGIDLSISQQPLSKQFTKEVYFYTPQSYLVKSVDLAVSTVNKIKQAVATQTTVLITAFVLSIILTGYNYYETSNQIISLDKLISEEKLALGVLKDIKTQYQQYQLKVKTKDDRIKTIQDIQVKQLIVPTILKYLQNCQSPLNGLMKFNSVDIAGRNISLSGEAIDKVQTLAFIKDLSDTRAFLNLNPTYDSTDSVRCKYSLTTNYSGPVRGNEIALPINSKSSQATQAAQVVQMINNSSNSTANNPVTNNPVASNNTK